jgi:hypothetical protein
MLRLMVSKPGGTIAEGTSGNTGMGLALKAIKDIKLICVMSKNNPEGGYRMLEQSKWFVPPDKLEPDLVLGYSVIR